MEDLPIILPGTPQGWTHPHPHPHPHPFLCVFRGVECQGAGWSPEQTPLSIQKQSVSLRAQRSGQLAGWLWGDVLGFGGRL